MHIIMCVLTIDVEANLGKLSYRVQSEPLTAREVTSDLARLSRVFSEFVDKLGSCSADVCPRIGKDVDTGLPIVGGDLGSDDGGLIICLDVVFESWMNGMPDVRSKLLLGVFIICFVPAVRRPWWQTRLKCPILPHLRHTRLYAGQFFLPPSCCLLPHPMQGGEVIPGDFVWTAQMSDAPCMSERDFLAASNPRHFVIA